MTRLALGHLALALDEDRSAILEVTHDVRVVHDLPPDVDGRPVRFESLLDGFDGPLDPSAVAAGGGQENAFDHLGQITQPPCAAAEPSTLARDTRGLGEGGGGRRRRAQSEAAASTMA